jgi:hypothetical protein
LELRGVIPRIQDAGVETIVGSEVCNGYGRHAGGWVSKPGKAGNDETRMANEGGERSLRRSLLAQARSSASSLLAGSGRLMDFQAVINRGECC